LPIECRSECISGTTRNSAIFHLKRSREETPYTTEDVRFTNGDATLASSLDIPKGPGPFPAVIFLHGAGPEIRWGASRFFADYFARRGIAALICDKRGTGESTGDWRRSDFDALAGDALAAVRLLKTHARIDPKKIGIYGHSQGGTIAPLIASRSRDIAFVISAAGGAIPMWQSEIQSLRTQVRARGVQGESLARADAFIDQTVAVARSAKGPAKTSTPLAIRASPPSMRPCERRRTRTAKRSSPRSSHRGPTASSCVDGAALQCRQ
jgi:alpha-beta hydrolase superfamily lysophospholipase